jgi:hypothetical protein
MHTFEPHLLITIEYINIWLQNSEKNYIGTALSPPAPHLLAKKSSENIRDFVYVCLYIHVSALNKL